MFYALNWLAVVCLFLIWSLAAWAFHSVAAWTVTNAGSLVGGDGTIAALQMPGWLAAWIPSEYASSLNLVISSITPAIQAVLEWMPAMAGVLSITVWAVWGIGAVLLIVLGLLAPALIPFVRARVSASATSFKRG